MLIRYPSYYESFRCLAGRCPDSCCREWDVLIDEETEAKYRSVPGELGRRLAEALRRDEDGSTVIAMVEGKCPLWRSDGLCGVQVALGEQALCRVCRDFPRIRHEFGDFTEYGLELSCPEAARLILSASPVPMFQREVPGGDAAEYDRADMEVLLRTRDEALEMLSDPSLTVPQALSMLLLYGYHAQAQLDGEDAREFDRESAQKLLDGLDGTADFASVISMLQGLEILTEEWTGLLTHPGYPDAWPEEIRALGRYFVSRYWLQAVSDFDLTSRVKFCVLACIVIRSLGGSLVRTAQLFSKEIENDIDNMDAILDFAYTSPAMTDINLLNLLKNN